MGKHIRVLNIDGYVLASIGLVVMLCLFAYTKSMAVMAATLGLSLLFINKPGVLFPVMYFAALSGSVFSIEDGVSIGRYLSLIFIISCFINIISQKEKKSINSGVAVVIIVFTFFSVMLGYEGSFGFFVTMLINLLVFFLFPYVRGVNFESLIDVLCFSAILSVALLSLLASRDSAFLMAERFNLDDSANADNLAMMIEQIGALCVGFAFFGKNTIMRIICSICVFGAVLLIILTGSRSALIALLVAAFLCVIVIMKSRKMGTFSRNIIIFLVLGVLGYFFVTFISGIDNPLLDRFTAENVIDSGGAGRSDLMKIILTKIFPDHFLFGSGMGIGNMCALGKSYGLEHVSHNLVIDFITQVGIIGFIIFFILVFLPILKKYIYLLKFKDSYCIIVLAVVIAVVFNGIGEVMYDEKMFWNDLALLVFAYNTFFQRKVAC